MRLKVVADHSVEKEFGTGIVKVTPAHDLTDFEIGQRQNLPLIKVIDERGKMNENAGIRYQSMKAAQAREQIVADMQALGLIEKIDEYEHNVARCDRCNSVIEPLPSKQWFLKMDELAKLALKAVEKKEVKIHPERWVGPYINWLKNIRDWNISRQLWWGHKIPIEGEEDVLDTWFSSALWPFATLGWPNEKNIDFKEYYPTEFITSARDILYLWIIRMIFSGKEFTGKTPYKDVLIHATVLTKDGKRMSKSLGTGINPLELIDKYGADALRFGLATQATGLQDIRFGEDLLVMGKKFANKVWNIARFAIVKVGENYDWGNSKPENVWTNKMDETAKYVTEQVEKYNFAEAANTLYHFIWHEIADKYIEESKNNDDDETKNTLVYLLINSLKLLHPFMPFLTEEIYSKLPSSIDGKDKKLLLVEDWPTNK